MATAEPKYIWREHGPRLDDAERTAACMMSVRDRNGGELTPRAVLEDARSPRSYLHSFFEWDDTVAAEKYREVQAGQLIRAVMVVLEDTGHPVRAFASLSNPDAEDDADEPLRTYVPMVEALSNDEQRDEMIARALSEMRGAKMRFRALTELAPIFEAYDRIVAARVERKKRASSKK